MELNLAEAGYSRPTAVQMFTIPMVLIRRDVLVCAPTGSGKSKLLLNYSMINATYITREALTSIRLL